MTAREALDRTVLLVRDVVSDNVSDDAIMDSLQSLRVRCIADEANVSTHAGQTALVTLVSLIIRMGVQVALDVPEVEILGPQPPLRGTHLRAALVDFGADVVPGTAVVYDERSPCDLIFVLGNTPATGIGSTAWRLTGTEWAGTISRVGVAGHRWEGVWSVGAMTAAALAAPEVFKAALRPLPLRSAVEAEYLATCHYASWDFEGDGIVLPMMHLMPVDIISAGAIAQAALFALFRLPSRFAVRLFDDDLAELSNVNRQMLFRRSDSGTKVDIVARSTPLHCACTPLPERFILQSSAHHLPVAQHALVGVDDIPARWEVQRATEGWLGVGATSHFNASTSSHEPGQPCAGCLHWRNDDLVGAPIPTVSFVSFWAGLALAVRLLRQIGGRGYRPRHQHLWLSTLRMNEKNSALWYPVPARRDCPVECQASRNVA